jgi:hypothetical protein
MHRDALGLRALALHEACGRAVGGAPGGAGNVRVDGVAHQRMGEPERAAGFEDTGGDELVRRLAGHPRVELR